MAQLSSSHHGARSLREDKKEISRNFVIVGEEREARMK
jgi:hypothetical protein